MLSYSNFHTIVMYINNFFHASLNFLVSMLTDLDSETATYQIIDTCNDRIDKYMVIKTFRC